MKYRSADIYVRDKYAGRLSEFEDGYIFKYAEEYLNQENISPVSLTLPLQQQEFTSKTLFPFFDGLIPEGWLLDVVTDNWKIDIRDRFGILLVACKDCIGCVSIQEASHE